MKGRILIILVAIASVVGCVTESAMDKNKSDYNVLFIAVDDLRPQLGCYGDPMVKSPNIDKLASKGVVFRRAYCQQALCGPSRASFLTGLRPETTGIRNLHKHIRDAVPDVVTLPQLFKNNGYESLGLFKVFHLVGFDPSGFGNMNDPESWSKPLWLPSRSGWGPKGDSIFQENYKKCLEKGSIGYKNIPRSLAYEAAQTEDSLISDGETAQQALRYLRSYKDKQFFMAVGFYKPHLPFVAPVKYWDLYDRDSIHLPDNQYAPHGAPPYVVEGTHELRSYTNIPNEGAFSEELKKDLLHGYLASISYVDAQIGLLLDELDRLGLREKTIVVLLGDHGYNIGEHNLWAKKHTNFETSTNAPLIISAPGFKSNGRVANGLTEFVDIYPTLAELCNLKAPDNLDGKSLVRLLDNPDLVGKDAAFSTYPRGGRMGTSMKTDKYRYTEWKAKNGAIDLELYDHINDPNENQNEANNSSYSEVRKELKAKFDSLAPIQ